MTQQVCGTTAQNLAAQLEQYQMYLLKEERSEHTINKYIRDIRAFFRFLRGRQPGKEGFLAWKEHLVDTMAPASVNSMLAAVNGFFNWAGYPQYRVKPLKIQREIFSQPEKELSREEYIRLVRTAEKRGNHRLALVLQTICATGIRVSELHHITVEAVRNGRAQVSCKGKRRTVFLPKDLRHLLMEYLRTQKKTGGAVFTTQTGRPLNRSNLWREMKNLCRPAGVNPEKVFPHNLRHLFARTYYTMEKDIARLADLLGHTSINTTRIYTKEDGMMHDRQIQRLGLIIT